MMNVLQQAALHNAADARHPVATGPDLRQAYYRDSSIWNGQETLEELNARIVPVIVHIYLPFDDTKKYVAAIHPVYGFFRPRLQDLELVYAPDGDRA